MQKNNSNQPARPGLLLLAFLLFVSFEAKSQNIPIYADPLDEFSSLTPGNTVYGNAGNDQISGGPNGVNVLCGNAGSDFIYGNNYVDYLSGGIGNDQLWGGDDFDILLGGDGDDFLFGGNGDDILWGDLGNYIYYSNNAYGGPEDWTYHYISDPSDPNYGNIRIERNGTTYGPEDMLYSYYGFLGPASGGIGSNNGNDKLYGGPGNDELHGNDGIDMAGYKDAAGGVTASLATGQASNDGDGGTDTFDSIENLEGSKHNDFLYGDDQANTLSGLAGNDLLDGGKGADQLTGGAGNDTFAFGPGDGISNTITDYSSGDIIDLQQFGYDVTMTEAIANGSKVIRVDNDVVITLNNYTGTVNYKKKTLVAN